MFTRVIRAKLTIGGGLLLVLVMLIAGVVGPQYIVEAAPPTQSPAEGQATFETKCSSCHTVGQGDLLGPDLAGVTTRPGRTDEWLTRWIKTPDEMLAAKDPIAVELLAKYNNIPMPNLRLGDGEVASLVAYLSAPTGGVASAPVAAPIAATSEGNAVIGKNLFTGATRFENRGPACRACHTSSGIGALGGGSLGPDLTGSHEKLGDALITWPNTVAPMAAIFTAKPLTSDEEAHLLAFFQSASLTQRPSQAIFQLIGLALVGVMVFAALAQLIWRKRLRNVRRSMVAGR